MSVCFKKGCYKNRLQDFLSNSIKEFFGIKEVKDEIQSLNAPKYKVYSAIVNQNVGATPSATVLENTLGGAVTWTRNSDGNYTVTCEAGFPALKTLVFMTPCTVAGNARTIFEVYPGLNAIDILGKQWDGVSAFVSADGLFSNTTFEIRVYP